MYKSYLNIVINVESVVKGLIITVIGLIYVLEVKIIVFFLYFCK